MTQPNPDLKPEKARIATLGFVLEPTDWLSLSADYWFVYRRNEIVAPDYSKPEEISAQTRFPITETDLGNLAALARMCADPASGVTCPTTLPGYSTGNVASVIGQYKNRGRTLIDGLDVDARGRIGGQAMRRASLDGCRQARSRTTETSRCRSPNARSARA